MKKVFIVLVALMAFSGNAFAGTKAIATVGQCESTPENTVVCEYRATVSNKIIVDGLVEIDKTKSAGQLNAAIRAAVVAEVNSDTAGTMTSANDIFLAGGFVS